MMWGLHCFKSWASTQATVALSSAEAELYALTKGASQALGVMTLLEDFGIKTRSTLHTDASAAIGIVRRAGLGMITCEAARWTSIRSQALQTQQT